MFDKMIDRIAASAESMPVCPECGPLRKPLELKGETREVRYECPHQEAERKKAERTQQLENQRQMYIGIARTFYGRSKPPESYAGMGLADIDDRGCSRAGKLAAVRYVATWPERKALGQGIVLSGAVGTGKTMVAAAMAHDLVERAVRVAFLTVTELQRRLKHWDTAESFLETCKECDLLVLDDFGAERVTEWAASNLFDLVDARYQDKRPVILTTNLGGKALSDHYVRSLVNGRDKMDQLQAETTVQRVLSRLKQRNATVIFEGDDQRLLAGEHGWLNEGGAA